jgi:hypothetical protein
MPLAVEQHKPFRTENILSLGAQTLVPEQHLVAQLIQQFWRARRIRRAI